MALKIRWCLFLMENGQHPDIRMPELRFFREKDMVFQNMASDGWKE